MNNQSDTNGNMHSDIPAKSEMLHPMRRLPLKTRLAVWRAKYSIAGLMAHQEERKVVSVVAAVNGGLAILVIGCLSWIIDSSLMFPALGPTAFILFSTPMTESASPRSVILGHFLGLGTGWVVWHLMSIVIGGPVSLQTGGWAPVVSASLAFAVTCGFLIRFSYPHAPACASSLIIALGGVVCWLDVLIMAVAVVWITVQSVAANRLVGIHVSIWSPTGRAYSAY